MGPKGVIGGLFMVAGGLATASLLWRFGTISHTIVTGLESPGVVVGMESSSGSIRSRGSTHRPVVLFFDDQGNEQVIEGPLALGRRLSGPRATHDEGERVTVYYPPGRPEDGVMTGFSQHWSFLLLSLLPMSFIWVGFLNWRADKREREELGW